MFTKMQSYHPCPLPQTPFYRWRWGAINKVLMIRQVMTNTVAGRKLEALVPSGRGQRRISRVSCHGTFQGIMPWHITWYHVRAHHGVSCHAASWVLCHTTSGGIMPHHIAGIMPQQIARYHALAHCGVLCHGILQGTCSYTNVWQILDLGWIPVLSPLVKCTQDGLHRNEMTIYRTLTNFPSNPTQKLWQFWTQ